MSHVSCTVQEAHHGMLSTSCQLFCHKHGAHVQWEKSTTTARVPATKPGRASVAFPSSAASPLGKNPNRKYVWYNPSLLSYGKRSHNKDDFFLAARSGCWECSKADLGQPEAQIPSCACTSCSTDSTAMELHCCQSLEVLLGAPVWWHSPRQQIQVAFPGFFENSGSSTACLLSPSSMFSLRRYTCFQHQVRKVKSSNNGKASSA